MFKHTSRKKTRGSAVVEVLLSVPFLFLFGRLELLGFLDPCTKFRLLLLVLLAFRLLLFFWLLLR